MQADSRILVRIGLLCGDPSCRTLRPAICPSDHRPWRDIQLLEFNLVTPLSAFNGLTTAIVGLTAVAGGLLTFKTLYEDEQETGFRQYFT